jgi:hypothetical protein
VNRSRRGSGLERQFTSPAVWWTLGNATFQYRRRPGRAARPPLSGFVAVGLARTDDYEHSGLEKSSGGLDGGVC